MLPSNLAKVFLVSLEVFDDLPIGQIILIIN